jgi:hypothetical protein
MPLFIAVFLVLSGVVKLVDNHNEKKLQDDYLSGRMIGNDRLAYRIDNHIATQEEIDQFEEMTLEIIRRHSSK